MVDPLKVFVKNEPHTAKKLSEGRYRLITCVSLVDQMVDRVLMYPWLFLEVREVARLNSKNGWAPLPEGYRLLRKVFPADRSLAIDKTAWDWTMPAWVVAAYIEMRLSGCKGLDDDYANALWSRMYFLLGPGALYRLPSGEVVRQKVFGLQKSGGLPTLSLNGFAQRSQTLLALIRLGWKERPVEWDLGDDVLMNVDWNDEKVRLFVDELGKTGCLVKHALRSREFAGYKYEARHVNPLYPQRHRYTLRHVGEQEQDLLQAYFMLYALADESTVQWLSDVRERAEVDLGPRVYKMWARGLVKLSVFNRVPTAFEPW